MKAVTDETWSIESSRSTDEEESCGRIMDAYFYADVETDGPIPGPYSMLSFALVYAGSFDGKTFRRPTQREPTFYIELRPISEAFQPEALAVNGLDRTALLRDGVDPTDAMNRASRWIRHMTGNARPVLTAYPLAFDWTWLYWYFVRFCEDGSPFRYSHCFDIKTALAVKARLPISASGRSQLREELRPVRNHTHHALDDAQEQAEIFANIFEWRGVDE